MVRLSASENRAERSIWRELLLLAVVLSVLLPVVRIVPLSFLAWSDADSGFVGPWNWDSYSTFFTAHRGGVILENWLLAGVSVALVGVLAVPVLFGLKLVNDTSTLTTVEIALVAPFLFSPALRLFSLRELLSSDGHLASVADLLGLPIDLSSLLYTDTAVCLGLALSYAALLVLPISQALKSVPATLVEAARDGGMSRFAIATRVLLPLSLRGLAAGVILMWNVAWFSSLESSILGRNPSVIAMLRGLLAAKKYGESLAFALVPFGLSCVGVGVLVWLCKPEKLIIDGHTND